MKPRLDLLEVLANHLEKKVLPSTFDMRMWKAKTACGTVYCAIGHAYELTEFFAAGLRLRRSYAWPYALYPHFKNKVGFEAVRTCLRISTEDAEWLFLGSGYSCSNDPILVTERIREYIKKQQANE